MTKWEVCQRLNSRSLPIYFAFRMIGFVKAVDDYIYDTEWEAQERADELNAKMEETS